jgi:hypothetical protein
MNLSIFLTMVLTQNLKIMLIVFLPCLVVSVSVDRLGDAKDPVNKGI